MQKPILYSFRRCPYAMRARIAIAYAMINYEHREILLKNRPDSLYRISAKGTVPVLKLEDDKILDESLDIMKWAIQINDPDKLYFKNIKLQDNLILANDQIFKKKLDKYKYHTRFKELSYEEHQKNVYDILIVHNKTLGEQKYLVSNQITLADLAVFPFIRQCAHVDLNWFQDQFPFLGRWLEVFKNSNLIKKIMIKYPIWLEKDSGILVENT
ncbi:MAG: glutathione S-transferase N-terminal domain-containing protein [Fidelibacterota bacterium]